MRDFRLEAQKAAEEHLAACTEAMFAWEEGDDLAESPACAPFDGCDTCVVREVLHAGWPFAQAEAQAEIERLEKLVTEHHSIAFLGSDHFVGDRCSVCLADGVGAEQEDQPDPDRDQRGHDVEP